MGPSGVCIWHEAVCGGCDFCAEELPAHACFNATWCREFFNNYTEDFGADGSSASWWFCNNGPLMTYMGVTVSALTQLAAELGPASA